MNRIIFDASTIKLISLFESLTGAKVKDCITQDTLLFIVHKGDMGLAIGKNAQNLKRVESALKKQVKVIEHDDDPIAFVRNVVYPLKRLDVSQDGSVIIIKGHDTKTKSLLIGRDKTNLKRTIALVQRYFDISDIVVQ